MSTSNESELRTNIVVCCESLETVIGEYADTFRTEDFYSFSDADARKKSYKKAFNFSSVKIGRCFSSLDELMLYVTRGILDADKEQNTERIVRFGVVFNAYEELEAVLSFFVDSSEAELKKAEPSPAILMTEARKLLQAVKNLKEKSLALLK